jgi:hypothetical protein
MKKILSSFSMMVLALASSAQWTNVPGTLSNIDCASNSQVVGVGAAGDDAGDALRFNFETNSWQNLTGLVGADANVTHASIAPDGAMWIRRNIASPAYNLFKLDVLAGEFVQLPSNLSNISVADNCTAVGSENGLSNNVYRSECDDIFYNIGLVVGANYATIASDGTYGIVASSNNKAYRLSNGLTLLATNNNLNAEHLSMGSTDKALLVNQGELYFLSNNTWVWDETAPENVTKAEVAEDGTIYLITTGSNNVYTNHWDNIFCTPPPNAQSVIGGYAGACENSTITMAMNTAYTCYWFDAPINGNLVYTGNTYDFPIPDNEGAGSVYHEFYVSAVDNGCYSSRTGITIESFAAPAVTISGNTQICSGMSTQLVSSSDGFGTILWSNGSDNPSITVSPTTNTEYEVEYTTNYCVGSASVLVEIVTNPPLTVTGNNSICADDLDPVQLTVSGGNGYTWSNGQTGETISVSPTETTTYEVESVINANCTAVGEFTVNVITPVQGEAFLFGCSPNDPVYFYDEVYTFSGTYTANVGQGYLGCDSTVVVTVSFMDTEIVNNGGVLTSFVDGVYYTWYDCDTEQPIPGANQQTFTPTYSGSFYLELGWGKCYQTSECIAVTVGVDELNTTPLTVYPNPAAQSIQVSGAKAGDIVVLYDEAGRETLKTNLYQSNQIIDVSSLESGIYMMRVLNSAVAPTKVLIVR